MSFLAPAQWAALVVLGAVVALDTGPWLQAMLARPLPAGALLGVLWGDPGGGAFVGAVLELVYVGVLPVGAARYPEAGLAGVAGTGLGLWSATLLGEPSVLLGLLWGLVAGEVGRAIESWRRRVNAVRVERARAASRAGDAHAIPSAVERSLALAAVLGAGSAAALVGLGMILAAPFVDLAPHVFGLRPPLWLLAALACGAALRLWPGGKVRLLVGTGLAAGVGLAVLMGGEAG